MTGQSGMSCSTRGGPSSPLLLSNRTGHGEERPARPRLALHGITWHWHWHCSIPVCWCEIGAGPKPSLTDRLGSMPSASPPGVPAGMASAIATACICGLGPGSWVLGEPRGLGGSRAEEGRRDGWLGRKLANNSTLRRDPSSSPAVPGVRQSCQLHVAIIMSQNDGVPECQIASAPEGRRTRPGQDLVAGCCCLCLCLCLYLCLLRRGHSAVHISRLSH